MGRKPNQLVLEFFERGQKLDDSSNRYAHTCKLCHEHFPKGRLDSLIAHLLKKCPSIPQHDRDDIVLRLSETPNQHGTPNPMAVQMRRDRQASGQIDPAIQQGYNMSPLETLAEVSRQRLDSNGEYIPATGNLRKRSRSSAAREDALTNTTSPNVFFEEARRFGGEGDESFHDTNAQLLAGLHQFTSENQNSVVDPSLQNSIAPIAQMIPAQQQQIAMAASAASELMPRTGMNGDSSANAFTTEATEKPARKGRKKNASKQDNQAIDPQLQDSEPQLQTSTQEEGSPLKATLLPQRPIAINPIIPHAQFLNDFSVSPGASKPKARGRFSPSRRKEVQEVRKQGACIRCRMLKKPCSGGTPCTTCQSVESARLWKQPCIRTRIADEFDLYSQNLYFKLAQHEVVDLKGKNKFQPSPNNIEASHFRHLSAQSATFSSLRASASDDNPIDPNLSGRLVQTDVELDLVNTINEDMTGKLDQYIKQFSQHFFDQEPSSFMHPTLRLASELAVQNVDILLSNALDLWASTIILVDPITDWNLALVPAGASYNASRIDITDESQPQSRRMIRLQLLSACEKRATKIAKSLMSDLERRLLQRQQASSQHFETFLTAVILLNCFEKMCWFYNTWSVKPSPSTNLSNAYEHGIWPFEDSPEHFVNKGNVVGGVVTMLLKMRGIPPRSEVGESGFLRLSTPPHVHAHTSDSHGVSPDVVASWFERIAVTPEMLLKAQQAMEWDEKDCRCWDLRFIGPLLLPETS